MIAVLLIAACKEPTYVPPADAREVCDPDTNPGLTSACEPGSSCAQSGEGWRCACVAGQWSCCYLGAPGTGCFADMSRPNDLAIPDLGEPSDLRPAD